MVNHLPRRTDRKGRPYRRVRREDGGVELWVYPAVSEDIADALEALHRQLSAAEIAVSLHGLEMVLRQGDPSKGETLQFHLLQRHHWLNPLRWLGRMKRVAVVDVCDLLDKLRDTS